MIKKLFYSSKLNMYEWQKIPETDDEALKAWSNWYIDDDFNYKSIGNDKVTPSICCSIIVLLRVLYGWSTIGARKKPNEVKAFADMLSFIPKTIGYDMSKLQSHLNELNATKK